MKRAVVSLAVILASSLGAFASNCPTTTYDMYLGSGFSCTIGNQTYSDFGYTGTSNPPGFAIPAGSVGVTPLTSPSPGIQFNAGRRLFGVVAQVEWRGVRQVRPILCLVCGIGAFLNIDPALQAGA